MLSASCPPLAVFAHLIMLCYTCQLRGKSNPQLYCGLRVAALSCHNVLEKPSSCNPAVLWLGRGIGGSTIFKHFWEYSSDGLAADALALLEHLGWERTHLVGMSLGGAPAPCTLTLLETLQHPHISACQVRYGLGGMKCSIF